MTLTDDQLDTTLRALDAAPRSLTPAEQAHKDALLTSILGDHRPVGATPGASLGSTLDERQARTVVRRRRARRAAAWLLPVAAAAGIAVAATVSGGPTASTAFASWTPDPRPVDAATLAVAERSCRDAIRESLSRDADVPAADRATTTPEAMHTVVAEKRGAFLFLAMASPDGSEQQCFYDASAPDHVTGSTGGFATTSSAPPKSLSPQQLDAHAGGLTSGAEGTYTFTTGRVGAGIRAVTIHSEGKTIRATVHGGWFAAWWPVQETPVNSPAPLQSYDVTLLDGRVLTDVPGGELSAGGDHAPGPREVGDISTGGGAAEDGSMVVTVGGRVGADVASVVVHAGSQSKAATIAQRVFSVELPEGTDTSHLTFDVTLRDGTVLKGRPAAR